MLSTRLFSVVRQWNPGRRRNRVARSTTASTSLAVEALEPRVVLAGLPFSGMVVFGDSLSDTGNVYLVTGGQVPTAPPFFEGHFTNGPNWIGALADEIDISTPLPALLGGTNFAFGGARSSGPSPLGSPSLNDQVAAYLNLSDGIGPTSIDPADNLMVIWGGSNNFFDLLGGQTPPTQQDIEQFIISTVSDIASQVTTLAQSGAEYFLVSNIIPLGQTPGVQFLFPGFSDAVDSIVGELNAALEGTLNQLEQGLGVEIMTVDTHSRFVEILATPADFGFTNVTDAFYPTAGFGDQPVNGLPFDEAEGFLFYELIHPTTVGHALIGQNAAAAVLALDDLPLANVVIAAPGPGSDTIRFLDANSGAELHTLTPYPGFLGGITIATGDVNDDGVDDIMTGAGPGGGPHVKVFDGSTQAELFSFFAYDSAFTGGVNVAVGDVNDDGFADIVTGAGTGGGPHVRVFDGQALTNGQLVEIASFMAYDQAFSGGVNVAVGDVNGDNVGDIITGAGQGGGPHVRAFNVTDLADLASFFAYDTAFNGGVLVSSGDVDGDGIDEIFTGAGAGGGPHVKVFQADGTALRSFFAFDPAFTGGVRVSVGNVDGDGNADLIAAAGPGGGPHVRAFDGESDAELALAGPNGFFAFEPDFTGGVFVATSHAIETAEAQLLSLKVAGGALDVTAELLTEEQLRLVLPQALAAWGEPRLASVPVVIRDLPGDLLGLGGPSGVIVDIDAAGHGWALTEEDLAEGRHVDLLTVIVHELGHALGHPDLDAVVDDLMAAELKPGERKLPRGD
jgi:phospholipase/lecithinase/hemolysin